MMIKGVRLRSASITQGNRLATAVPDVVSIIVGFKDALEIPSEKNPAPLSSRWLMYSKDVFFKNARLKGVFLEPGQIQTLLI